MPGRGVAATPNHYSLFGGVEVEIGTFNPTDLAMQEQFRVTPFNALETGVQSLSSNTTGAPVQLPVAVSSSHGMTVAVGDVFDLAYGVNTGVSKGTIEMTSAGSGASISFILPEGVWLTSALGGVFGTVPAPACSDDIDNDGDALVDYPADPGCLDPASNLENPACNDGLDNDGDGGIDFNGGPGIATPDPQCAVAYRNKETPNPSGGCGLGAELALVMPLLGLAASRRRRANWRNPAPT
jgi:hypothetical protein